MEKSNHPDYTVPIPFIPETEKDPYEGDKKGVMMKLKQNGLTLVENSTLRNREQLNLNYLNYF
jgi:hypothetical protein